MKICANLQATTDLLMSYGEGKSDQKKKKKLKKKNMKGDRVALLKVNNARPKW